MLKGAKNYRLFITFFYRFYLDLCAFSLHNTQTVATYITDICILFGCDENYLNASVCNVKRMINGSNITAQRRAYT